MKSLVFPEKPILCLNPQCDRLNSPETHNCIYCGYSLLLKERYHPIRLLGQGGFGRTFEALDKDNLNNRCVIKQFLPIQQETEIREKCLELFKREAEQLNNLGNHPQIPRLLAFFEQNQHFYLVQEFIDGDNLLQITNKKGSWSEEDVRIFLCQLLKILEFIHERQVIHRDIKPENIIQRQDGSFVLIDFGVSKHQQSATINQIPTIVGTPIYAPPEQLSGYPVGMFSDIYALGVTAIHLLKGIMPFSMTDHPLFDHQKKEWNWRLECRVSDKKLAQVIDKMLPLVPAKRYQKATQVLKALKSSDISLPLSPKIWYGCFFLSCIFLAGLGFLLLMPKIKSPPDITINPPNQPVIVGKVKGYNSVNNKIVLNLLAQDGQTYSIMLTPTLLNQIPNAPPPQGLLGRTIRVVGIKPLYINGQFNLKIYKSEDIKIE